MALKKKKLEVMLVSTSDQNRSFVDILNSCIGNSFNDGNGKILSLKRFNDNTEYFLGYLNTTKQAGIPPKHSSFNDSYEALPINADNGEGLGYSNVFVYDKLNKVLMYEFNKNGCYLASFNKYLSYFTNDGTQAPIDISFTPLLRPEAYDRMLNINVYKTLEVKIATPTNMIQEFVDENDALSGAIRTGIELETDTIDLKFDIKGRPIEGMPSQRISNLLRRINILLGREEHLVEKLTICGYYLDPEDNHLIKDEIDFLLDRYKKTFTIDEPSVLNDPQTREKINSLLDVYLNCRTDFSQII
ncbi:MAG: DUF6731 family protein [Bacteroidota bacterium]